MLATSLTVTPVSVRTISFTQSAVLSVLLSVDIMRFQHPQQWTQQFWTSKNHQKLVLIPLFALQKVISTFFKFLLQFSLVKSNICYIYAPFFKSAIRYTCQKHKCNNTLMYLSHSHTHYSIILRRKLLSRLYSIHT
jgi:hypothetical protein